MLFIFSPQMVARNAVVYTAEVGEVMIAQSVLLCAQPEFESLQGQQPRL
jgi:hypothetical protein